MERGLEWRLLVDPAPKRACWWNLRSLSIPGDAAAMRSSSASETLHAPGGPEHALLDDGVRRSPPAAGDGRRFPAVGAAGQRAEGDRPALRPRGGRRAHRAQPGTAAPSRSPGAAEPQDADRATDASLPGRELHFGRR